MRAVEGYFVLSRQQALDEPDYFWGFVGGNTPDQIEYNFVKMSAGVMLACRYSNGQLCIFRRKNNSNG